jgi:hypothetical protein
MTISRDAILLDNIKEALAMYQRSLVWAITAALSGLLVAWNLRNATPDPVHVLTGTLSLPSAWSIAQVLYLVFGALAYSAIRRYLLALTALNPTEEILQAIRLYPSLATLPGRFFRIGSVLVPPVATGTSWTIELLREHSASSPSLDMGGLFGLLWLSLILLAPYIAILTSLRALRLWTPLPSQSRDVAENSRHE